MQEDSKHSVQITRTNRALSKLKLSWKVPEFSAEDGIGPLESLHYAGGVVAVVQVDAGGVVVLGSGVMVGPGLILTATHVLDEFPREGSGPAFMTFLPDTARAWLPKDQNFLSRDHKYDAGRKVSSDIALFSCTLNSAASPEHPLTLTPMEIALPLIGERLWAVGFRHQGLDGDRALLTPLVSSGLVTQAYPFGRGERMASPCFEVAMETVGGMSGGAVYNSAGNLVGIVSSSFDGGPSYVTLLWDAIRLRVECAVPKLAGLRNITLLQAKNRGLAKLKGNVDRDPWGDITFRLSDAESKLLEDSMPAEEKKAARVPAMSESQLEDFEDKWNSEMEQAAGDRAIEILRAISIPQVRGYLRAWEVPAACLRHITGYEVEDFGGVEDFEVTSTSKVGDAKVAFEFQFQLHQLLWIVQVPEKEFLSDKAQFLEHFAHDGAEAGNAKLLMRQRCYFKGRMTFDEELEEFSEVAIISAAVPRKKRPKINRPREE